MSQFSMGRVISLTFGVLGRNIVPIGAVVLAVGLLDLLLALPLRAGLDASGAAPRLWSTAASGGVAGFLFRGLVAGAVTTFVVADLTGGRAGFGQALRTGLRVLFPLIALGIVVALGVGLASVLLVVPGILLGLRWFIVTPVRVIEGPSLARALSRSAALTAGHRWKLFGLGVAWLVLVLIMQAVTTLLTLRLLPGLDPVSRGVVAIVFNLVDTLVTTSISLTGLAVCYVELRRLLDGGGAEETAAVFA